MKDLSNIVKELRKRIEKYRELLSKNEALTRYVLIDPLLRALEWNTEDPKRVRPEEKQRKGRPDYVLYVKDRKAIAIEAKSLGTKLDEEKTLDLGFKYSWKSKIPYFIITDGNMWRVYSVKEPGGKLILETNISKEEIGEVTKKLSLLRYSLVAKGKRELIKAIESSKS